MEGDLRKKEEKKTEIGLELEVIRKKEKQKKNGRRRRMEKEEGKRSRGCCHVGEAFVATVDSMIHNILKYYFNIFIYLICFYIN